jgi:DNA polymerase III gamma/tau subunit
LADVFSEGLRAGPDGYAVRRVSHVHEYQRGQATDVVEIDGASNTGVDQVRDLQEMARFLHRARRRQPTS